MLDHPLEYALIEFGGNKFSGKIVPELLDLAERAIVRFVDIVFLSKDEDGGVYTIGLNDLDTELYSAFIAIGDTSRVSSPKVTWRRQRANWVRALLLCSSCGRTCGRTASEERLPQKVANSSSAGRFPVKRSSSSSRTLPRISVRTPQWSVKPGLGVVASQFTGGYCHA